MGDRLHYFEDLERALESSDPRLAELVCAYAEQPDPPNGVPEDHDPQKPVPRPPSDAWNLQKVRTALGKWSLYGKTDEQKKAIRQNAWRQLEDIDHPPPRLRLGPFVLDLDDRAEAGDAYARAQLLQIVRDVRISWGIWRGLKKLYKRAEARFDAELFGLFAWRFDQIYQTKQNNEVGGATYAYLRRRAWRFLRHLGASVPEAYPNYAVQVMRHYRGNNLWGTWVLPQMWAHEDLKYVTSSWITKPPQDLSRRAFDEAWKVTPEPLLRLLEDGQQDEVLDFAIRSLQQDFPDELRSPDVAWLVRLGSRPQARLHQFVVETLKANPDFHQSKLKAAGLHDLVLSLLRSTLLDACLYAVEYAQAHAPDLDDDALLEVAQAPLPPATKFAVERLEKRSATQLGLERLLRMLKIGSLKNLAQTKLKEAFAPTALTEAQYIQLRRGGQENFLAKWYQETKTEPPTSHLIALVESDGFNQWQINNVLRGELGKRPIEEIGAAWVMQGVHDRRFASEVQRWLTAGKLKGAALDVDWLKGLVNRASTRNMAFTVLTKFVEPHRVGFAWLLSMSRQSDAQIAQFAQRYLLQHFAPADFAGGNEAAGEEKIWSLLAPTEPDAVRQFAANYLTLHHPVLGPKTESARQLGVAPRLARESYTAARVTPVFRDALPELRRFAVAVAKQEIVVWNEPKLAYRLSGAPKPEARRFGTSVLRAIGEARDAGSLASGREDAWRPVDAVPIEWLDGALMFELAESRHKSTREAALDVILTHYAAIGSTARLVWLMESSERDVRIFAVRLLWSRRNEEFEDRAALELFVRRILFGLPPGRMERRGDDALKQRPIPASVAKRRLIEVVRDLAMENAEFAALAAAPLTSFAHSEAKGEWHACVAALARIRRAHPSLASQLSLEPTDAEARA